MMFQFFLPVRFFFALHTGTGTSNTQICASCIVVANAVNGATYTCTTNADSRVSACAAGYFKTVGGSGVADTCTACTHGVATYSCASGEFKSGSQCDGKSSSFTFFYLSKLNIQLA